TVDSRRFDRGQYCHRVDCLPDFVRTLQTDFDAAGVALVQNVGRHDFYCQRRSQPGDGGCRGASVRDDHRPRNLHAEAREQLFAGKFIKCCAALRARRCNELDAGHVFFFASTSGIKPVCTSPERNWSERNIAATAGMFVLGPLMSNASSARMSLSIASSRVASCTMTLAIIGS